MNPAGGFASLLDRWQQEGDQNANNCNDDQQFDEGETILGASLTFPHDKGNRVSPGLQSAVMEIRLDHGMERKLAENQCLPNNPRRGLARNPASAVSS
jgi:hypothetical protein